MVSYIYNKNSSICMNANKMYTFSLAPNRFEVFISLDRYLSPNLSLVFFFCCSFFLLFLLLLVISSRSQFHILAIPPCLPSHTLLGYMLGYVVSCWPHLIANYSSAYDWKFYLPYLAKLKWEFMSFHDQAPRKKIGNDGISLHWTTITMTHKRQEASTEGFSPSSSFSLSLLLSLCLVFSINLLKSTHDILIYRIVRVFMPTNGKCIDVRSISADKVHRKHVQFNPMPISFQ